MSEDTECDLRAIIATQRQIIDLLSSRLESAYAGSRAAHDSTLAAIGERDTIIGNTFAKLAAAARVLRAVEWAGTDHHDCGALCPSCDAPPPTHAPTCELAATLAALEQP